MAACEVGDEQCRQPCVSMQALGLAASPSAGLPGLETTDGCEQQRGVMGFSGSWAACCNGHKCLHSHWPQAHRSPHHPYPQLCKCMLG